ncbi:unnamed protein product [Paramecium sonneborni]|uniref:Tetratricopeptide repeat protein n=1 Tax=Paramecium sonneborni TaxID=65129 RepID=A0A8S1RMI4_9CILI|nr:unnamed protein product [Paramecium sonneborni]
MGQYEQGIQQFDKVLVIDPQNLVSLKGKQMDFFGLNN